MASTRATGKHRRPRNARISTPRGAAGAAGIAGVAAGVVGAIASPALAASGHSSPSRTTDFSRAVDVGDSLAEQLADQARSRQTAVEQAKAESAARKQADENRRRAAAAKAKRAHEAKERAARAAERRKLHGWVAPVAHPQVSTPYQASSGLWSSGAHTGIDFHAAQGTPVHAVAAGEIVEAGNGGAYGNNIVIKHHDGTYTQYGHLSVIKVSVGQKVGSGERIALSGNTGNTTGPHLHFEARTGPEYGSDMDPVAYLRRHGVHV